MQIERLLHNNTGISEQEEADLLKAANALFIMYQNYINAGFTTERAFELVKITIGGIKR